jgi:hypothetical protein
MSPGMNSELFVFEKIQELSTEDVELVNSTQTGLFP